MMKLDRIIKHIPGWDDIYSPCQHDSKGDHGICNDKILYALKTEHHDGRQVAISLEVNTRRYPSTIPAAHFINYKPEINATDLSLHVQLGASQPVPDCLLVPNCSVYFSTSLGAAELWKRAVVSEAELDQPDDKLWDELEAMLRKLLANPNDFEQPDEPAYLKLARLNKKSSEAYLLLANRSLAEYTKAFAEACLRYKHEKSTVGPI